MKGLINYWLPVIVWMGAIYWGSSQSVLPGPLSSRAWQGLLLRKAVHLVEYAVLSILIWRTLFHTYPAQSRIECAGSNDPPPATPPKMEWTSPLAFLIAFLYAVFDKWHQSLVPNREPRILDVGIDMVGMVTGLGFIRWRSALK